MYVVHAMPPQIIFTCEKNKCKFAAAVTSNKECWNTKYNELRVLDKFCGTKAVIHGLKQIMCVCNNFASL